MLDRLFPRSVVYSITQAERCLREMEPRTDRAGVSDRALRLLGRIRSQLEYKPINEVLSDLPEQMAIVPRATSTASEAIGDRYFPTQASQSWTGEAS